MNPRLIGEFIARAAEYPAGQRGTALVSIVAEHCATICDVIVDNGESPAGAAETIREAFVLPTKPTQIAQAARLATLQ